LDNNNNTWLWILLIFGAFWLLNNHSRSNQEQLFVVRGHEHHVGISDDDDDGLDDGEEVKSHQPKGQVHHILNRISSTHDTVRGWFEIFENLAIGSEKILTVVTTLSR